MRSWYSCINYLNFLQIKSVTLEVLNVIRETKNDDLTNTLQKIISVYQDDLADMAVEMCTHLVSYNAFLLFIYVLEYEIIEYYFHGLGCYLTTSFGNFGRKYR